MSYESRKKRALELRDNANKAEYEFLIYLYEWEQHPKEWKDGQARLSFTAVLEGEGLVRPHRYEDFKAAVKAFGAEKVKAMGVDAAVQATRLKAKQQQERYVEAAIASRVERGVPWSEQQAATQRRALTPPGEVKLQHEQRLAKQSKVELEAADLRKRVRELERENARLKRENVKLLQQLERAKSGAGGRRRSAQADRPTVQ